MNVFFYKKSFKINDYQARALNLTTEAPFVYLVKDKHDRIFLTDTKTLIKEIKYFHACKCRLKVEGWSMRMILPTPWEANYSFVKVYDGVFQLTNKIHAKESIYAQA